VGLFRAELRRSALGSSRSPGSPRTASANRTRRTSSGSSTDAFAVPGVGTADCSVFHGSIDDLAALAYQGAKAPPNGFHGEYVTAGQFSLAQLAAKLGVPPSALMRMTAVHYKSFRRPAGGLAQRGQLWDPARVHAAAQGHQVLGRLTCSTLSPG